MAARLPYYLEILAFIFYPVHALKPSSEGLREAASWPVLTAKASLHDAHGYIAAQGALDKFA
jgi:hypothetical protein